MRTFVCTDCMEVIRDPYMQYQERMEYRRVDAMDRRYLYTARDICRDCVDKIKAQRTNPSGAEQQTLGL